MFTCSDATQQEIVRDIEEQELDGLVVASCSPKLHTFTFRGVAKRAGLNPYQYTQVNIREQCSWTHTDDKAGATRKAISLVRAGIARTRLTSPLEPLVVETTPRALVIGGGIAGLRAALGLADIGLGVFLVEREAELGGWVGGFGEMYPHAQGRPRAGRATWSSRSAPARHHRLHGRRGGRQVRQLRQLPRDDPRRRRPGEEIEVDVGSIVVATGFDSYEPAAGEFGYGIDGVVTLPEFKELLDDSAGPLAARGEARAQHRLRLLRRQPPGPRRPRVLLALLLHRGGARLAPGRRPRIRRSASTTSTATCAPTAKHELMYSRVARAGLALPPLPRRRAARS